MAEILSRDEFRTWLIKNRRRIVGHTRMANCCPLATYLQLEKNKKRAQVGRNQFTLGRGNHTLPSWAARFTYELDTSFSNESSIKGATALRLLDAIGE